MRYRVTVTRTERTTAAARTQDRESRDRRRLGKRSAGPVLARSRAAHRSGIFQLERDRHGATEWRESPQSRRGEAEHEVDGQRETPRPHASRLIGAGRSRRAWGEAQRPVALGERAPRPGRPERFAEWRERAAHPERITERRAHRAQEERFAEWGEGWVAEEGSAEHRASRHT